MVALVVALAAVAAVSAMAAPRGINGQIAFARFNQQLGDTQVYVVNPDGTGQRLVQGPTDTGECPAWFPDGAHIATCGSPAEPGGGSRIINPRCKLAQLGDTPVDRVNEKTNPLT